MDRVGRGAPEKASRQRQRQRLIEACITALHVHGPSRVTIDKVVAIADMSPGIVNFYFETKAALLVACLEHLAAEFEARVLGPVSAAQDDPEAALERLIELYLDPDIASPRKVSVWYAFWGEASAREEYYAICGKRDLAFADLVRDLVARCIGARGERHLDADAVALGLIGALEMMWQEIAFREECQIDRARARARCRAYLGSVFPGRAARQEEALLALVAAELLLAGQHAVVAPAGWPERCILIRPASGGVQTMAVVAAGNGGSIDLARLRGFAWVALVASGAGGREIFIVPGAALGRGRVLHAAEIGRRFGGWRNHFRLHEMAAEKPRRTAGA